jgi:hypothetical protein
MADYQVLHGTLSVSDFCKPFVEETFKQIGSPAWLVVRQLARRLESDRRGPQ